jgi:hypothetical protein
VFLKDPVSSNGNCKPKVESRLIPRARSKRVLAAVLAGKTQEQACLDEGYSPKTSRFASTRILRRAQGELCEELERQGFGTKALAEVLINGCKTEDPRAAAQFTKQVIEVCGDSAPTKIEHSGTIETAEKRKAHAATINRLAGYIE